MDHLWTQRRRTVTAEQSASSSTSSSPSACGARGSSACGGSASDSVGGSDGCKELRSRGGGADGGGGGGKPDDGAGGGPETAGGEAAHLTCTSSTLVRASPAACASTAGSSWIFARSAPSSSAWKPASLVDHMPVASVNRLLY